jgi:hypothetical protein
MEKLKVNIWPTGAAHWFNGSYMEPNLIPCRRLNPVIEWVKSSEYTPPFHRGLSEFDGITIVEGVWMWNWGEDWSNALGGNDVIKKLKSKYKVGLLNEALYLGVGREHESLHIQYFERFKDHYEYILTWDPYLLDKYPNNTRFCPAAYTWIREADVKIHQKTKNISMVYSHQNAYEGHIMRHDVANYYYEKYDSYYDDIRSREVSHDGHSIQFPKIHFHGSGQKNRNGKSDIATSPYYNRHLEDKGDGLRDYRFTVVIENGKLKNGFSEKIIDAFLTGTIPIYWGPDNIGDFFDDRGIIQANNAKDIIEIIESINPESDYERMFPYVEKNYQIAKDKYEYNEYCVYEHIKHLI